MSNNKDSIRRNYYYCVISQRIIGEFLRYPQHEEFLIISEQPIKISDLNTAVRNYVAKEHQLNAELVFIYDMIDVSTEDGRRHFHETVERRQWCYEYHGGSLYKTFY